MSTMEYYFTANYAAISGIIFLLIFLLSNATLDKNIKKLFYILASLEFIELITCNFEIYFARQLIFSPARILFTGIGQSLRPILIFLTILLVKRESGSTTSNVPLMLILLFNIVVSFSPFFTDLVYSYDVNNQLIRGPLGYLPNIILVLYMFVFLAYTLTHMKSHKKYDKTIIFLIVIFIVFCMILEILFSIRSIGRTSIVLATIFFYMYYQSKQYLDVIDEERQKTSFLSDLITKDNLTGLLNKQGFSESLEQSIKNMQPDDSLALLFFDIDYFKKVNDVFGHIYGDKVLKMIAKNLKSVFRKPDMIGRFGGDEFYVLIKNNSEKNIVKKLDAIQKKSYIEHIYQDKKIMTSVSIGIAVLKGDNKISCVDYLSFADAALYKAKNNGKNQYHIEYIDEQK